MARRPCASPDGATGARPGARAGGGDGYGAPLQWCAASLGTDGVDGPTDAAGAWVDGLTLERARRLGLDPMAYLHDNDSWSFFRRVGGHITTGPTDTNVGDVQIVLIPAGTEAEAR